MKTGFKLFTTASILFLASFNLAHAEPVVLDRVAVIVDEGVVMESELNEQTGLIKARMRAQGAEIPPDDILRAQVLEHLIVQQLQFQIAKRADVQVDPAELDAAMVDMRNKNNMNQEEFTQQLQAQGLDEGDLREEIRKELVINRVQHGVLNNRLDVSEKDVDSFLKSKEGQFWTAPEYHIGHILISLPNGASEAEIKVAKEKVDSLRERSVNGEDFNQLATLYSAGQNALDGGDLGWRKPAQLPEIFAENIAGLQVGEVSQPFRSGAGFHMLKILDQRGGGERLIQQTKVRHILLQTSVILSDEQAKQQLINIRQKIIDGTDFGEMAKEYSKDPGSMLSGGDLGWAMPGQFVPEFEATMQAAQIGDISMPFRTQHGWHILQVEDRRQEDMSETMIRNQAFNLLRNRRFEEELPIWLQEIRDEAYIDIKLADLKAIDNTFNQSP